jgi:hypothetical protein
LFGATVDPVDAVAADDVAVNDAVDDVVAELTRTAF